MSSATPLGRLLRERRKKNRVSWKRLEKATGLEDQTMMRWERGVTRDPPIGKVLLYAREVGISLEELAEVLLPANGAGSDPRDPSPARTNTVGQASARAKPGAKGARKPQQTRHRPAE